jgi:hypothetical protein
MTIRFSANNWIYTIIGTTIQCQEIFDRTYLAYEHKAPPVFLWGQVGAGEMPMRRLDGPRWSVQ